MIMQTLKLSNGLVALGYEPKENNKDFTILLANQIAKNEKTLYLSWTNYSDKIHKTINEYKSEVSRDLLLNTNIEYFGIKSFLNIINLIESYNLKTIFIDDINNFLQIETNDFLSHNYFSDTLIEALNYIVYKYNVRIIFSLELENINKSEINLSDFQWSRLIRNDCNQILAIKNLLGYENIRTSEYYDKNSFKVLELKNEEIEITESIITF